MAGVSDDGREMLRLYPIRYRRLPAACRFDRFDLVEMEVERPRQDGRPESRHVIEDSIVIIERGRDLNELAKIRLWAPFIAPSLQALSEENRVAGRSFGIVRPDPGSMRFFGKPVAQTDTNDQALSASLLHQSSLFEDPLTPLQAPEFSFGYKFTSAGIQHEHIVHDWEVQTAYRNYQKHYGADARRVLEQEYGENIPARNPHFILGTMKQHPRTFIIIGILRSSFDPAELAKQGGLF